MEGIDDGRTFLPDLPANEGIKIDPQTSRRFIGNILEGNLSPLRGFLFPSLIFRHFGVSRFEIGMHNVRTDYFLDESADLPGPNGPAETLVNPFINCYGQFLLQFMPPIRVVTWYVNSENTFRVSKSWFILWG